MTERPTTAAILAALGAIGAIGLALRLVGASELPWAIGETGSAPLPARALALAAGAATVPLAFALAWSRGAATAGVLALLIATSPWHVHASRVAGPATCAFLGMLAACGALGARAPARGTARDLGRLAALLVAAIALWAATPADARRSVGREIVPLLAGDVGVAVPLLALLELARTREWRRLVDAALLACVGAWLAGRCGLRTGLLPWVLPPVFLAAAAPLGRWIEAAGSWSTRLALVLLAIVPTLPSLGSEQLDGGRFELASLAPALARARAAGEPLYASDPALAARAFQVAAQPLAALPDAPSGRPAFVLLLLERGRVVGGESLPADVESGLELLARSGRKRLDLGRFEARLYKTASPP